MKRKVGLVLAHHNTNYGALLQSYATQQVIEGFGFDTEIIDYKPLKFHRGIEFDWGLFFFFWEDIKAKISKHNKKIELDGLYEENKRERVKRWREFEREMLHNIHVYHGYPTLTEGAKNFDAVLIGSDQMWLPGVSFGSYLSLRFAKGTRRISYATSLGVSEYPRYCYNSARKMFESIDYLSVREEQGKNIIQSLSKDLSVKVVCDPTYLLSKEEWLEKIPPKKMSEEAYVLLYQLGNSIQQMKMAKEYAANKGLRLYSILSDESSMEGDVTIADKVIIGASVEDFVNLIRGAEYVITDSFHGLAFSVINEKQFYIFYRKRDDSKASRNSRIDNILNMWKLQNRFIPIDVEKITDSMRIDYNQVTSLVVAKRAESMEFLKEALTF